MENYKKKYKEALDRARYYHSKNHLLINCSSAIENIFPELKESEDERIRKWCISHFNACINVIKDNDEYKEYLSNKVIAWLEKQGEKSTIIDVDKMAMKYGQTKDGDFGLPVNCMIRAYRKGIKDVLSIEKQGEKKPAEDTKLLDADNVIEWLKDTINETTKNYGVYKETHLTLPYNSVEDLINDFKEDFGL